MMFKRAKTVPIAGVRFKGILRKCRECRDEAWVRWEQLEDNDQHRILMHGCYCLDCARLLGLVVPVKEAAEDLGVDVRTVRRWINTGKLDAYKDAIHHVGPERWWILKPYNYAAVAAATEKVTGKPYQGGVVN